MRKIRFILLAVFLTLPFMIPAQTQNSEITINHQIDDWTEIGNVTCESFDSFVYKDYNGNERQKEYCLGGRYKDGYPQYCGILSKDMNLKLYVKSVGGRLFYRVSVESGLSDIPPFYFSVRKNTDASIPFNACFSVNACSRISDRFNGKLTYYLDVPEW